MLGLKRYMKKRGYIYTERDGRGYFTKGSHSITADGFKGMPKELIKQTVDRMEGFPVAQTVDGNNEKAPARLQLEELQKHIESLPSYLQTAGLNKIVILSLHPNGEIAVQYLEAEELENNSYKLDDIDNLDEEAQGYLSSCSNELLIQLFRKINPDNALSLFTIRRLGDDILIAPFFSLGELFRGGMFPEIIDGLCKVAKQMDVRCAHMCITEDNRHQSASGITIYERGKVCRWETLEKFEDKLCEALSNIKSGIIIQYDLDERTGKFVRTEINTTSESDGNVLALRDLSIKQEFSVAIVNNKPTVFIQQAFSRAYLNHVQDNWQRILEQSNLKELCIVYQQDCALYMENRSLEEL